MPDATFLFKRAMGLEQSLRLSVPAMCCMCTANLARRSVTLPEIKRCLCAGGGGARVAAAQAIVGAGVAVMGHVGLMPQSISVLGGFRPHGQTAAEAVRVLREAKVRPGC